MLWLWPLWHEIWTRLFCAFENWLMEGCPYVHDIMTVRHKLSYYFWSCASPCFLLSTNTSCVSHTQVSWVGHPGILTSGKEFLGACCEHLFNCIYFIQVKERHLWFITSMTSIPLMLCSSRLKFGLAMLFILQWSVFGRWSKKRHVRRRKARQFGDIKINTEMLSLPCLHLLSFPLVTRSRCYHHIWKLSEFLIPWQTKSAVGLFLQVRMCFEHYG